MNMFNSYSQRPREDYQTASLKCSGSKEAILLASDWNYNIWNFENLNNNYDKAVFSSRIEQLVDKATTTAKQQGCDRMTIVDLGGMVYRPRGIRKRTSFDPALLVGSIDIIQMYNTNFIEPILKPFSLRRYIYAPKMYYHNHTPNSDAFRQQENTTHYMLGAFAEAGAKKHPEYIMEKSGDVFGTFQVFKHQVGMLHCDGKRLKSSFQNEEAQWRVPENIEPSCFVAGWNIFEPSSSVDAIPIIPNGRLHHHTVTEQRMVYGHGVPHQKMLVFDEKNGLISTHALVVE